MGILGHWIAENAAVIVAAISAAFAIQTYRKNARTKRAEFLLQLHKSFFVDDTYKSIRELLDDSGDSAAENLGLILQEEPSTLTDFLNFFELIAYFQNRNTLRFRDVRALLGYYLDLLQKPPLLQYVNRSDRSFENLANLLKKWNPNRTRGK